MNNIILIGSGNVATHLAFSLVSCGYKISQIWSQKIENAKTLSKKINSHAIDNLMDIKKADLYIIAVKDDKIESIINKLKNKINNVVHTSGNTNINVFTKKFKYFGVLYPLQTFNKTNQNIVDFPLCIEANNPIFEKKLLNLANTLSNKVELIDSQQRKIIHLAAVFSCNFTNHMFSIADNLLAKANIDFKILLPLIQQTYQQLEKNRPSELQTGPAARKDLNTINKQLNDISDEKIKNIYRIITNSIMKNDN